MGQVKPSLRMMEMVDRIAKRAREIYNEGQKGLLDAFDDARHEVEDQEGRRLTRDEQWELGDRFEEVLEGLMEGTGCYSIRYK